jgi:hypothetical protein
MFKAKHSCQEKTYCTTSLGISVKQTDGITLQQSKFYQLLSCSRVKRPTKQMYLGFMATRYNFHKFGLAPIAEIILNI